jgi:hypothetical protein
MSEYQTWREYLIEKLSADYERAIDYLDVALEEYQVDRDAHLFSQSVVSDLDKF